MNLAEIRKKSQQEKEKVVAAGRPGSDEAPLQFGIDPASASVSFSEEFLGEPSPAAPLRVEARVPAPFDPLEMLLEGRTIAGCEEMIAADEAVGEDAAGEEYKEFLCFRVADEFYAISIMEIKEIIKPREITEVPRVPSFISGVLSLRGIIIPVFNMHERLGLQIAGQTGKERIVVVKRGEEFTGVLVDEVIQVVRIAEETIEQPPAVLEGVDRDFVQGIGRYDGRMLILLNLKNILDLTLC